jgi:hypothetical protein
VGDADEAARHPVNLFRWNAASTLGLYTCYTPEQVVQMTTIPCNPALRYPQHPVGNGSACAKVVNASGHLQRQHHLVGILVPAVSFLPTSQSLESLTCPRFRRSEPFKRVFRSGDHSYSSGPASALEIVEHGYKG